MVINTNRLCRGHVLSAPPSGRGPGVRWPSPGSLHVLHLLPELLELALRREHEVRDHQVPRLGARRVELAVDLLDEEVDPLADRPPLAARRREGGEVALEPHQLLGDVTALGPTCGRRSGPVPGARGQQAQTLIQRTRIMLVARTCSP